MRFLSSRLLSCCIESQVFLSRAYGLLLKSLSETSIIEELDSMKSNLKSVEKKHASILAIGYLVANLPPLIERLLILLDYLKSDNLGYVAASLRSLAVIGTSFVLPIELVYLYIFVFVYARVTWLKLKLQNNLNLFGHVSN